MRWIHKFLKLCLSKTQFNFLPVVFCQYCVVFEQSVRLEEHENYAHAEESWLKARYSRKDDEEDYDIVDDSHSKSESQCWKKQHWYELYEENLKKLMHVKYIWIWLFKCIVCVKEVGQENYLIHWQ